MGDSADVQSAMRPYFDAKMGEQVLGYEECIRAHNGDEGACASQRTELDSSLEAWKSKMEDCKEIFTAYASLYVLKKADHRRAELAW
eukprot:CAMPEP_0119132978 /NCGR_PEP_ID=MMETSP1310-20130426/12728_1 /TAXON_ID=464262 /ORGANISM="Genus nov. species nov., Strain RCC2339" /LENGTH=86 /DNA_ID=CAMNT_0007123647 /DNA_START=87 /DNA_END=344 /DNA_ORIENTATION=+